MYTYIIIITYDGESFEMEWLYKINYLQSKHINENRSSDELNILIFLASWSPIASNDLDLFGMNQFLSM